MNVYVQNAFLLRSLTGKMYHVTFKDTNVCSMHKNYNIQFNIYVHNSIAINLHHSEHFHTHYKSVFDTICSKI